MAEFTLRKREITRSGAKTAPNTEQEAGGADLRGPRSGDTRHLYRLGNNHSFPPEGRRGRSYEQDQREFSAVDMVVCPPVQGARAPASAWRQSFPSSLVSSAARQTPTTTRVAAPPWSAYVSHACAIMVCERGAL